MPFRKYIGLILLSIVVGCNYKDCDNNPTSPIPPTPTPPPVDPTPPPPPFNPGIPFSWDDTRGILAFPGTQATEAEIIALDSLLLSKGWPTITYHVCAETSFWEVQGAPWPAGPTPFDGKENLDNLRRFLSTTAELGSQVLLDVYCTVRDESEESVDDNRFFSWASKVAKEVKDYDHVALHISNEYWHPRSRLRSSGAMHWAHSEIRKHFDGLVSSDDNFNPGDIRFNDLGGILQFADAHPWRNPDPTKREIREMVDRNGGFLVISEPTAYSIDVEGGCCTDDKQQILNYMNRCESIDGCIWMFHSTDGLGWPAKGDFDWIPSS